MLYLYGVELGDSSIRGAARSAEEVICAEWEGRLHLLLKMVGGGITHPLQTSATHLVLASVLPGRQRKSKGHAGARSHDFFPV